MILYVVSGIRMLAHVSLVLSQITRLTEGRTDGRTDTFLVTSPRLHSTQRGKNHTVLPFMKLPKRLVCLEERRELPRWG